MNIIKIGDNLKNGDYQVHSSFKRVKNYISANSLISIVSPEVGFGPNYITLSNNKFSKVQKIKIENDQIFLNDVTYARKNYPEYDSNFLENISASDIEKICHIPAEYSLYFTPKSLFFLLKPVFSKNFKTKFEKNYVSHILEITKYMNIENLPDVVKNIKGLGFGLTPSGDDFNIGVMYALNLMKKSGKQIANSLLRKCYTNSLGNNMISNSLLFYAYKGLFFSDFKRYLQNLTTKSENLNLQKLLDKGHTSGSDMLTGLVFTLLRTCK